jgi:hypothetical protein
VPGDVARAWLANSSSIVGAVRRRPDAVAFIVDGPLLDLCDAYLGFWIDDAEDAQSFDWTADVDVSHVAALARQWVKLAQLTDTELRELGVGWAPEWTAPFYEALLRATVAALESDGEGRALAAQLAERPPGTRTPEP